MKQDAFFRLVRVVDSGMSIDTATITAQSIEHYHPRSTFQPSVLVRGVYDHEAIRIRFDVEDQYVIAKSQDYFSDVWKDSCVEFFFSPGDIASYFNFEANCGGALLASYVPVAPDSPRVGKWCTPLPWEKVREVVTSISMPRKIDPEIAQACAWHLEMRIPFSVITDFSGVPAPTTGTTWRGNFYKCASWNSHPHWGYWAPMDESLNFHRPQFFGTLLFS